MRRRYLETHELLGRGKILKAYDIFHKLRRSERVDCGAKGNGKTDDTKSILFSIFWCTKFVILSLGFPFSTP